MTGLNFLFLLRLLFFFVLLCFLLFLLSGFVIFYGLQCGATDLFAVYINVKAS